MRGLGAVSALAVASDLDLELVQGCPKLRLEEQIEDLRSLLLRVVLKAFGWLVSECRRRRTPSASSTPVRRQIHANEAGLYIANGPEEGEMSHLRQRLRRYRQRHRPAHPDRVSTSSSSSERAAACDGIVLSAIAVQLVIRSTARMA